jgi:predicted NAD/FAD-binding protein
MRVAVIGSGISGLSAAYSLRNQADVTLYEAGSYFGGHSNTVDMTLNGVTHGVDTGFLVFNERTYPQLINLFAQLGVATAKSDMSFSVMLPEMRLEWSGSNLNTVFAQRRNLLRPRFVKMLLEVLRFNRVATSLAQADVNNLSFTVGDFLDREQFSRDFREWYFLPMIGCIWSCPTKQMLHFPMATMLRFCHNHGLLQVENRPQWFTVAGGSKNYVRKIIALLDDTRLNTPVRRVTRHTAGVSVSTDSGTETFDHVVMAAHSDQSLQMLADPSNEERALLSAIRYQDNLAVLHTDATLLPKSQLAWAAWNYERGGAQDSQRVCLHYLINKLQPLPFADPVVVSLNPAREPDANKVFQRLTYAHPVFDEGAIKAQQNLAAIQGRRRTWYCGAWCGYGFHEDGLKSGIEAARGIVRMQGLLSSAMLPAVTNAASEAAAAA